MKTKTPQKLEWGPELQQAFETLKKKLCETPILRTPVWDHSFLIQVDASNYADGACLAQNFDCKNGGMEEHLIAYASPKLSDTHLIER